MQATIVSETGKLIMRVTGELNFSDNKEWRVVAEGMLAQEAAHYILDISALEMVDSAGLGMMLTMKQWASDRGRPLTLRFDADTMVGGMVRLAKFNEMFDLEEA